MSQRGGGGGGRRNKLRRGPPKADDHNRPAKTKQQQSGDAYHDAPPREEPGGAVVETKIENKSQKEGSFAENADNEVVVKKELESSTLDSNCNKSECVNIKIQYQKLLAERELHVQTIEQLKEEIRQLKFKDCQNNAREEIMEVDTSTKHTVASRDTAEPVAGPSLGDVFDKNYESAEKCQKLWKKEVKEEPRSKKDKSLEQVTNKNWADDNTAEEESAWPAHGTDIQQSCGDEAVWPQDNRETSQQDTSWDNATQDNRAGNQQNASWCDEVEHETKNRPSRQQDYAAKSSNITYDCPEQTRNDKRQSVYGNTRRPVGSNGTGSRDRRPHDKRHGGGSWHYEHRQQGEYGQRQGRERESWRNNRAGEQPVKHNRVLKEIEADLFTAPKSCSLAHCVAEDMRMGSGIAVGFRQKFKRVVELLAQEARTGEMAVLEDEQRFIYYLVTKRLSSGKPCLEDLRSSLKKMRQHMQENKVHDVAMPRIGCGLDRLEWRDVRSLLIEIFGEDDVSITVYNFNQEQGERNQPKSSLWIRHADYNLVNIKYGTGLLYLGSEDGAVSESLQNLLAKFPILPQYRQSTRRVGQFVRIECKGEVLYGLIIKKNDNDKFSFTAFSQCLENLRDVIWKDEYEYTGIEVVSIGDDPELDTEKLITIFKDAWFKSPLYLYICWPEKHISVYKNCYGESHRFRN